MYWGRKGGHAIATFRDKKLIKLAIGYDKWKSLREVWGSIIGHDIERYDAI